MPKKKIAVARLHLPNGPVLYRQVLEFEDGHLVRYFALTEELPFVEWHGGDYYLQEKEQNSPSASIIT